ncbi:hypothetical protein CAPTEDRAFT_223908 [Capitella teleta]|uniref:PLAT domain-containing protein n=1 Tax=Capitella teleta TaxID=283909 RepID=R7VA78_CAPTE|nr:hypothetical protein CAPTEDRAFT_223908 [Capitella teleta]|eukprot:ELU15713.1 hypothetical protein CAPTEDRAFT_223908 [Capitella teleta]
METNVLLSFLLGCSVQGILGGRYTYTVTTGSMALAETTNDVYATVTGSLGTIPETKLDDTSTISDFMLGITMVCDPGTSEDIGEVLDISVRLQPSSNWLPYNQWYMVKFVLRDKILQREWKWNCGCWLNKDVKSMHAQPTPLFTTTPPITTATPPAPKVQSSSVFIRMLDVGFYLDDFLTLSEHLLDAPPCASCAVLCQKRGSSCIGFNLLRRGETRWLCELKSLGDAAPVRPTMASFAAQQYARFYVDSALAE